MEILSRRLDRILDHYSVVVVGSGYGGAIAAARIARAGRDVAVLERGRELHPGEYPNSGLSALREMQLHTPKADLGATAGLFDFHLGPDITVLSGCGLGGTSLINGNVALEPGDAVFADDRWPAPLRGHPEALRPFMQAARGMLGSNPYPVSWPDLPKLHALEQVADSLGATVTRPDINVTFVDGPNAVGLRQNACALCGDCCSGCNYGAKNTVLMNYLPDAHWHGAHIFTGVAVRSVRRAGNGGWQVAYDVTGQAAGAGERVVHADVVVLAAGTLGSTEILLRSRDLGLPLSDRLGHGFSGNGDVLAFAYDTEASVRGVGLGGRIPREDTLVGPAIAGLVDLRRPGTGQPDALIIEEGAIPGALAAVLPAALAAVSRADAGEQTASVARQLRELAALPLGAYRGPVDRTLTYLVMSTDDGGGQVVLDDDRIQVVWPDVAEQPVFARDNQTVAAATRALHGTEIPDPLWATAGDRSLITVHPLGGCVMGDDAERGVVDHRGRVFDPAGGVHDGLYVCDGSVLPVALDANPLLTISALAERTAAMMIEEHSWGPAQAAVTVTEAAQGTAGAEPREAAPRASLEFTEHLTGFVSMSVPDSYAAGYEDGRESGARVDLLLTVDYDDVQAVLDNPETEARITGTVLAPELSASPLIVAAGRFTLLEPDPGRVETWHMRYQMRLVSAEGRIYRFEGHKDVRSNEAGHAWSEMTTLYTTIGPADGSAPGSGILHLKPADFTRLVRSIKVTDVPRRQQGEYRRAFLELFAHEMVRIYGGMLDEPGAFPSAPAKAPAVREPRDPDGIWWCDGQRQWHAGDRLGPDAFLRLVRYRAGDKGPVMLASGFGMSSHSFLAPTIDQNLAEYLAAGGYDVWLFDYRAGIDLPSSGTEFTLDDIAREDWPIAVAKVREETGRDEVQAYGHCVGSASLQMAILAGLQGVRTAVCAQFPMHPASSVFNIVKSQIRAADVLGTLGISGLSPDTRPSLTDEVLDVALRALPMPAEERCEQAVCRWVNAVYGCTHRHAQLNEATHQALNDMFGFGNIESMEHLSLMLRKGHAVTHTGGMDYFDHPERMAGTRLLLLQGMQNYIFHPVGSFRTWRWLRSQHPQGDYQRRELPGYAHLDALVGHRAALDVYPLIGQFLDEG